MKKFIAFLIILSAVAAAGVYWGMPKFKQRKAQSEAQEIAAATVPVQSTNFAVDVHSVGELEASQSTIISSSIRGDQGKVIYLVADGINVQPGEMLVKMDPTPFEEKIHELRAKIKDQKALIATQGQALVWETNQAVLESRAAAYETEAAELERNKIVNGDGPLEIYRLQSAMQKAAAKYEDLNSYSQDLLALEEQGYMHESERKQAEKKLKEEKDAYENAKMQYESFIEHVFPMQVKKAETHLSRSKNREEELAKTGEYKIAKAQAILFQSRQQLKDLRKQLIAAKEELALTEIKAPAPGMVVLREEYRTGQKRKPRIGDILVKNQPLLDLPDLNSMIVKTRIREVDLYKIEQGKKATIQVDAYPHLMFQGRIAAIGVLALADVMRAGGEKYFEVKIALDNGDQRLRPGMTARVTTHAAQVKDQLAVPIHAVYEHNGEQVCYTQVPGGCAVKKVALGATNEHWAEIKSGLQEGERIFLLPPSGKVGK